MNKEALIVVDYQNDFIDGTLSVNGGAELAPEISRMMAEVKSRSGIVVATRDWHPSATVHFDAWPVHCVAGSRGADYGNVDRSLIDVEIYKGFGNANDGYSGFEGVTAVSGDSRTGFEKLPGAKTLEEVLVETGIRVVRIVGLATDFCVKATALGAANLRKEGKLDRVIVKRSGIAAVNLKEGDGERAVMEMIAAGVEVE